MNLKNWLESSDNVDSLIKEIEKRWRSRTPASNISHLDPGNRVNRAEVTQMAQQMGIKLPDIGDDDFDRSLFLLFDRLKKEFPDEKWEKPNARTKQRRKELGIK